MTSISREYIVTLVLKLKAAYAVSPSKRDAVAELRTLDGEQVKVALLDLLTEAEPTIKRLALEAFVWLNKEDAINVLIPHLKDSNISVRWTAATMLGDCENVSAIDALVNTALSDTEADVRYAAVASLGKIGIPDILPILVQIRENDHSETSAGYSIRGAVEGAIERIKTKYE